MSTIYMVRHGKAASGFGAHLAPGLDDYTMDSEPPVKPDAEGRYPVAMPGQTKVL